MREYQATLFSGEFHRLAESPFYDPRFDRLSWVDILAGRLYTLSGGEKRCTEMGEPIGAAVPLRDADGYLVAGEKSLWKVTAAGKEKVADLSGCYKPWQRCNDAKADPMGRLFFGSSAQDGTGEEGGDLYRYDRGCLQVVQPGTRIANGMAWSRDRTRFWFSDSNEHAVFAYDYDLATGEISGRRVLFTVEDGVPDGMCVDLEDRIWLAVWGGSRVECWDGATGALLAVVRVPALHTSSCCFMGPDWDTLFITSAGDGLEGETQGRLFTCRVEARGLAPDYAALG